MGTQAQGQDVVLVWDLDETLCIFNSLINGSFARHINHAVAEMAGGTPCGLPLQPVAESSAKELGNKLADGMFDFLDNHFLYKQVERLDPMHVSDIQVAPTSSSAPVLHTSTAKAVTGPSSSVQPPLQAGFAGPVPHGHTAHTVGRTSLKRTSPDEQHEDPALPAMSLSNSGSMSMPVLHGQTAASTQQDSPQQNVMKKARSSDTPSGMSHAQVFGRILKLYAAGLSSIPLIAEERNSWQQLLQAVNSLTCGWVTHAASLLHGITAAGALQGCNIHHCIVTTGQLVASWGKLLLFQLSDSFPADQVYSASKQTKLMAFKKIRQRWGVTAKYLAVGDGREESRAAAVMHWPFIQISLAPNLPWPPGQLLSQQHTAALPIHAALARRIRSHRYKTPVPSRPPSEAGETSPRSPFSNAAHLQLTGAVQQASEAVVVAAEVQSVLHCKVPAERQAQQVQCVAAAGVVRQVAASSSGTPQQQVEQHAHTPQHVLVEQHEQAQQRAETEQHGQVEQPAQLPVSEQWLSNVPPHGASAPLPRLPLSDTSIASMDVSLLHQAQQQPQWFSGLAGNAACSPALPAKGLVSSLSSGNTSNTGAVHVAASASGKCPRAASCSVHASAVHRSGSADGSAAQQAGGTTRHHTVKEDPAQHVKGGDGLVSHPLPPTPSLSCAWQSCELPSSVPAAPVDMQRQSTEGSKEATTSTHHAAQSKNLHVVVPKSENALGHVIIPAGHDIAEVIAPGHDVTKDTATPNTCLSMQVSDAEAARQLPTSSSVVMRSATEPRQGTTSIAMLDAGTNVSLLGVDTGISGACQAAPAVAPAALSMDMSPYCPGPTAFTQHAAAASVVSSRVLQCGGDSSQPALAHDTSNMSFYSRTDKAVAHAVDATESGDGPQQQAGSAASRLLEVPVEGVSIHQLWPQLVLDYALYAQPWELPE